MSEKQLSEFVLELAKLMRFTLQYHTFDSRRSHPGFPDLVLLRPDDSRLIFAELKGYQPSKKRYGTLTPAQEEWRDRLSAVPGVEMFVWTPDDWQSGEIRRLLR